MHLVPVPLLGAALLGVALVGLASPLSAHSGSHTFEWDAPADAMGPGAFRVTLDLGHDNLCTAALEATTGSAEGAILSLGLGAHWSTYTNGDLYHVHSGTLGIDTSDGPGGQKGLRIMFEDWPVSGPVTFTVLNAAMDGWMTGMPEPLFPAGFDVRCRDEIHVAAMAGSREAHSFTEERLSGGEAVMVHGVYVRPAFIDGAGTEAVFSSPEVEVRLTDRGTAWTDWTLEAPSGTFGSDGWTTDATAVIHDGPGTYRFMMDRAGEGTMTGWFAGYRPVPHLDDVLRPA